jgi:hypothetical protein
MLSHMGDAVLTVSQPIPEPATLTLLSVMGGAILLRGRKRF